jgi:hypothetical protein
MSADYNHLESIDQPSVHHEESDINIRAVFGFGAALVVAAIVIHVAIWGLFEYFDARETRGSANTALPMAASEPRLPPEPRLQVTPRQDAEAFRAREDAILNGYAWVNRDTGLVRIPIAEAMRLTVQKGLPVRQVPPEQEKR